jgi:hypothetical protein
MKGAADSGSPREQDIRPRHSRPGARCARRTGKAKRFQRQRQQHGALFGDCSGHVDQWEANCNDVAALREACAVTGQEIEIFKPRSILVLGARISVSSLPTFVSRLNIARLREIGDNFRVFKHFFVGRGVRSDWRTQSLRQERGLSNVTDEPRMTTKQLLTRTSDVVENSLMATAVSQSGVTACGSRMYV